MQLSSDICSIRPLELSDVDALFDLRARNRVFFTPYEPRRVDPEEGWSRESLVRTIHASLKEWERDLAYGFGVFVGDSLIGRVNLTNVVRAAWQNANIGYYVDEALNGRGYGTEAIKLALRFAFEHIHLHRVQAAVMPRNTASRRAVEKAGFVEEGLCARYLQIAGAWEDHVIYGVTTESWNPRPS